MQSHLLYSVNFYLLVGSMLKVSLLLLEEDFSTLSEFKNFVFEFDTSALMDSMVEYLFDVKYIQKEHQYLTSEVLSRFFGFIREDKQTDRPAALLEMCCFCCDL